MKLYYLGGNLETPWSNVIGVRLDRGREGFFTREPLLGRGARRLAGVRGLAYYGQPAYDEQQRQLMGKRRVIPIDAFASQLRHGPLLADVMRFAPWLQADCADGPRPALRKPPVPLLQADCADGPRPALRTPPVPPGIPCSGWVWACS